MRLGEAVAFIRPSVGPGPGAWADLGAGTGTFTEALAVILGQAGSVVAVDRDPSVVAVLEQLAEMDASRAPITAAQGDIATVHRIESLRAREFDGVLLANVLHYFETPEDVLRNVHGLVKASGRVVVVEYDRRRANAWVPYPLPFERLRLVLEMTGFASLELVNRRSSAFQGDMYCAVAFKQP